MWKSKTKNLTLSILLLIVVCYASWRLFLADVYWRKTDIIYAAWRQPDQSNSNWSNMNFDPYLLDSLFEFLITGADFSNTNSSHTDIAVKFKNTKFTNANLKNARLQISTFWNADLEGADLLFIARSLRRSNLIPGRLPRRCRSLAMTVSEKPPCNNT